MSGLLEDFANAIEQGDSIKVESLLAHGSVDVNARLPRKFNPPPLLLAVRSELRRVDVVEMLLSAGARIDDVDDNGQTACIAATRARSVDVLAVLLTHRPNLEVKDNQGFNALKISLLPRIGPINTAISAMLIDAGASMFGWSLCWLATRSAATIQALINRGVVINQLRDGHNCTSLHSIASQYLWTSEVQATVNMLVNVCGVDLEERNANGDTCTHLAASRHDMHSDQRLRCFVDAGADVNVVNRAGQTPLHRVVNYECSAVLIAAGADLNAVDRGGRTALLAAKARSGSTWTPILRAFMAAGADTSDVSYEILYVRDDQVETSRHEIANMRLDIARARLDNVRQRALHVCVGLQSLGIDALQMCEILQHACGPAARFVAFHQLWNIATTVKHFHQH
jgi:ankyrin repeat protein